MKIKNDDKTRKEKTLGQCTCRRSKKLVPEELLTNIIYTWDLWNSNFTHIGGGSLGGI